MSGNSVGKPEGIVTNSSVGVTASGVSATLNANSLISLYHAVKPDYSRNGTFVFNRATLSCNKKATRWFWCNMYSKQDSHYKWEYQTQF